jgi:hypothetical protein
MRINQRPGTSGGIGGYNEGAKLFDNTSWATEKNHHTDQVRTEYRNRYDQPKPFHKPALVNSHGRKKANEKTKVYDIVDCNPNTNWKLRTKAIKAIYDTNVDVSRTAGLFSSSKDVKKLGKDWQKK